MAKESLEPLSLLVWETSGFKISTICVVWTQLNTSSGRTPEKAGERQETRAHLSEEVGDPGRRS